MCGEKFNDGRQVADLTLNAPVTDDGNGPFILPIRTNDKYVGRGFRLNYKQIECETTTTMETSGDDNSEETATSSVISSSVFKNRFHNYKQKTL